MKAGYRKAAWRLLQPRLIAPIKGERAVTWAEGELAPTPLRGASPSLPILRQISARDH